MKKKKLGSSDLELTRIGLGTWAIGGDNWRYGWGPQDDEESIKTIHKALDMGINWIDTAAVYGIGHSEEIIGKALHGMHEKPIIATKCTRIVNKYGALVGNFTKESIKGEAEASLKRLKIDIIDLYQIHWPDPDPDIEEGWETISELIKEGKVRYGGVSNFSVPQLVRIKPIHPVTSLQPPYNMIQRNIESGHLQFCKENNIGIICYSPMYKGLLTGKFSRERLSGLPQDDHRNKDPHFREPEISINLELVDNLALIAKSEGISLAHLSIAWTLRHEEVTAAIVGARHPGQIEENSKAADIELSNTIIIRINELLKERDKKILSLNS
ncbi:MAG: aldo/keto reductase [Spirochaetales bacterium]|nr:aldo/keto reductase [Spirochaetales bacterium]